MKNRGKKRVLFIDDRVPHTWLGSGFPRARAILLTLLKHDCFVTFYPLAELEEDWASVYADMAPEVEFMTGYGPALLEPFLRNRAGYYDTIFISRPHNMTILKPILDGHPEWFEKTNLIYDAEAVFVTREVTLRQLTGKPLSAEEADALLKEEVDLASAADCVIAVSESDGEQFRKHGIEGVRIVGHSIAAMPTPRGFGERIGFLFVGAIHEEASPNGDSVIWFLEEVLPKIRAGLGADIPVTIAGVNKSERVKQLAGPSVRITGHLPDLTGLYDSARVFVAPTRYAAGIPHKVHEAAARGIPIVATPLLASQLGWSDGDPILVGGDADSFAQKCIQLHTDAGLWTKLRQAGLDRIQTECSIETFERHVAAVLTTRSRRSLTNVGMDR
jgi:glycosyltransferase involved in cell wall biosynthesis